jgi:hypothetical protein
MESPFFRAQRVSDSSGEATVTAPVLGIVAPHPPIMVHEVGGARTDVTAASIEGMRIAAGALRRFAPETIVVISPHTPALADAFAVDTAPRTGYPRQVRRAPGRHLGPHRRRVREPPS